MLQVLISIAQALGYGRQRRRIYREGTERHISRLDASPTTRYAHILETILARRSRRILEIGVWNGERAWQMLLAAKASHPAFRVDYVGCDLFEMMNDSLMESEFSKRPPSLDEVQARLAPSNAKIRLLRGFSQDTLATLAADRRYRESFDFILIDGGHSVETIASDWGYAQQLLGRHGVVIFDDCYEGTHSDAGLGCDTIVAAIDRSQYDVKVLERRDQFEKDFGRLSIRLVQVTRRE